MAVTITLVQLRDFISNAGEFAAAGDDATRRGIGYGITCLIGTRRPRLSLNDMPRRHPIRCITER